LEIIKLITDIRKAPGMILNITEDFYGIVTKPHPTIRIIPNKKYLIALMKVEDYKPLSKVKYEINKATKRKYYCRIALARNYINDMIEINESTPVRQGRPMTELYTNRQLFIERMQYKLFYFAVKDEKVYAYLHLRRSGDIIIVNSVLGHADYLKDGIMYLLFDYMFRTLTKDRLIMYDSFLGNTTGLNYFKRKLGFKPFNIKWKKI